MPSSVTPRNAARARSYEGSPWSETDDRDLRAALAAGKQRPRQIAKLLMRSEAEVRERIGDELLLALQQQNRSLNYMAVRLRRSPGSIRARTSLLRERQPRAADKGAES